jgi:hypothetical protein
MKRSWDLKPNLLDCLLEARIVPAAPINNLGVIALTTSGLSLVTPFPGASNNASGAGGSSNTAASVSGAAMPTSFYITGRSGISTFSPGNFTGNPAVGGGGATGAGGVSITIQVGSGSDDASASSGASSGAATSSRANPGSDGATAPIMAYIGTVGTSSSSTSPMSSSTSGTQTQTAPVPSLPPLGVTIPGSPNGTTPGQSSPMNPSLGAPRLLRGLGTSLMPALPGGLGVGSLNSPPSSGPGGY